MNTLTIVLGLVCCCYGLTVLIMRITGRTKGLGKLGPMKDRFGERAGSVIHFIFYVLMPLFLGLFIILAGIKGLSLGDLL